MSGTKSVDMGRQWPASVAVIVAALATALMASGCAARRHRLMNRIQYHAAVEAQCPPEAVRLSRLGGRLWGANACGQYLLLACSRSGHCHSVDASTRGERLAQAAPAPAPQALAVTAAPAQPTPMVVGQLIVQQPNQVVVQHAGEVVIEQPRQAVVERADEVVIETSPPAAPPVAAPVAPVEGPVIVVPSP